jgi:hypothetical protein
MKLTHYLAATAVALALSAGTDAADSTCRVRLALQLTPDAARTDSSGFLKSLVADPRYSLKWIRGSDTTAIVDLTGPGSDTQCQQGMDVISRSAHVVSVKAIAPQEVPESTDTRL